MSKTTVEFIREKYSDWDIIEVQYADLRNMVKWIRNEKIPDRLLNSKDSERTMYKFLQDTNNVFTAFVERGVIITIHPDGIIHYPFEIRDNQIFIRIVLTTPKGPMTAMKVRVTCNLEMYIQEENKDLLRDYYLNLKINPLKRKELDQYKDRREYYLEVIKTHLFYIITVNAYLVMHEKDVLVRKITQSRPLQASTKKKYKSSTVNPYYRYVVEIPENYVPRKFEHANYTAAEWTRSGHITHVWTLKENATIIAGRHNGTVRWDSERNGKVKVAIIQRATTVHRRIGKPEEGFVSKTYK